MSTNKLPNGPWLRLQDAVTYWQENMPTVANAVLQRDKSHVKTGEATYLLPPPAREFADTPEIDPNIIAMGKVAAAERGCGFDIDILRPDPDAATAMREFDHELSKAALNQRVQFRGKRDTSDASDHETIPFGYFSTSRGFCFGSEIEAFPYPMSDEALFRDAVSGKVALWHDVFVHRDEFVSWLAEAYPSCANLVRDGADLSRSHPAADLEVAALGEVSALKLEEAVEMVLQSGSVPGSNVLWKTFCHEVRSKCDGVVKDGAIKRGFGDKSIQRIVKLSKTKGT